MLSRGLLNDGRHHCCAPGFVHNTWLAGHARHKTDTMASRDHVLLCLPRVQSSWSVGFHCTAPNPDSGSQTARAASGWLHGHACDHTMAFWAMPLGFTPRRASPCHVRVYRHFGTLGCTWSLPRDLEEAVCDVTCTMTCSGGENFPYAHGSSPYCPRNLKKKRRQTYYLAMCRYSSCRGRQHMRDVEAG